jgi:hypothetical protein
MKTNAIGNVVTSTYTSKPFSITTKNILTMLQAEFGATFPTGAKLGYSLETSGFVVLTQQGEFFQNVKTNAADTNYQFGLTNSTPADFANGKAVVTTTLGVTNSVETISETLSDYGIIYKDGKGNKFHFNGIITLSFDLAASGSATTNSAVYKTLSIKLTGSGGGTFYNAADGHYDSGVFTSAVWNASGANIDE